VSFEYFVLAEYSNEYTVGESSFFLQYPLKQILICNAYCVFEHRLLKFYLLSEILPTSASKKRDLREMQIQKKGVQTFICTMKSEGFGFLLL
jgi:hypothetical protein